MSSGRLPSKQPALLHRFVLTSLLKTQLLHRCLMICELASSRLLRVSSCSLFPASLSSNRKVSNPGCQVLTHPFSEDWQRCFQVSPPGCLVPRYGAVAQTAHDPEPPDAERDRSQLPGTKACADASRVHLMVSFQDWEGLSPFLPKEGSNTNKVSAM